MKLKFFISKSNKITGFILFSFSLLAGQVLLGQNSFLFKGKIIGSESLTPISYVSVAILKNDTIIDGTLSDSKGEFLLIIASDFDSVRIGFIGYQTKIILREEITFNQSLEIYLESNEVFLDEVTIEVERTVTEQLIDRKVINVGSDLQQTGATALELFDQVPEIQTDLSTGEISLRGNSNVLILINGKPSGLSASEVLSQIPSSSIDKIEIITSPSAKYQADGISGILNIILKKNTEKGLNLSLNAGVGTKRYNTAIDGNYSFKQLNFRWSYGRSERKMDSKHWLERTYKTGMIEEIYAPNKFDGSVDKLTLGFDVLLFGKNEFSLSWNYIDNRHDFYNEVFYNYPTGQEALNRLRIVSHFHYTNTLNANYRYKFSADNHFLEIDYNMDLNNNDFPVLDYENDVLNFEEYYANNNVLQRLSIDYALPVSKRLKIELGGSWNRRKIDSDYVYSENNDSSNVNTQFYYNEDVYAIYTSFTSKLKEKVKLKYGIRFEYFQSFGNNSGNILNTAYTFADLFPSVHMSYELNKHQKINVGISRRITRPNFNHINPYRIGNPYFSFVGNQTLLPEYGNNLELNYSLLNKKVTFSTTVFYRFRQDIIQRVDSFSQEGIQFVKNVNGGNNSSTGIEVSIRKKITGFWQSSVTANYYFTKIYNSDLVYWDKLYSSSAQIKNVFNIGKIWRADISYRHTFKSQNAFDYVLPRDRIDFAIRGKFLKNSLSANLTIIDILNINSFLRLTKTPMLTQNEKWIFQSQTRGFILSLNYQIFRNNDFSRNRKTRNYDHGGAVD